MTSRAPNKKVVDFLAKRRIDNVQKLNFLLYFQQHPSFTGTAHEVSQSLYLADTSLVEKIMADLKEAGLVVLIDGRYQLSNTPQVRRHLARLSETFEDPLKRQQLLDVIQNQARPFPSRSGWLMNVGDYVYSY